MATKKLSPRSPADPPELTIVKETASVSTRDVLTGRVRVTTTVDTFEEVAEAALQSERVEVTRVAVGKPVDAVPHVRTEGDLTIVPVVEEILVVEKRLILKEELHIRKTIVTEMFSEPVSLRRQRAVVERIDGGGNSAEAAQSSSTRPESE